MTLVLRGFSSHDCLQRAAALSFEAIFAVIPLLAIGVSILKSLGVYADIDRGSLRLWLEHTVGVSRDVHLLTLEDGINQILDAVDAASLSSVGAIGAVAFLYAIGILFNSVEGSLDTIFGTPETRSLRRRLVNYAALLFALPLLVFAGSAPLAALASKVAESGPVGFLIHLGSAALASLGLAVVLRLTPNTRVRWRAALLGGAVGASLGYLALQLQVYAQVGVARYNLLYSGFAALPLLLLWVHVTWIAVLLGAELAALVNNPESYKRRVASPRAAEEEVALG